jgi:hypothetical protein
MNKKEHCEAINSIYSKYNGNVIYWDVNDVVAENCIKEDIKLSYFL